MADRLSDKSPDAFRTISEVADHLDLPQHVLRFWETKFPEIRPVKRAGGRRFYRPDDVDLLRAIRHLLYTEGYTIKGVQKVLKDQGTRSIQGMGADLHEGRPVDDLRQAPVSRSAPAPKAAAPSGGEGASRGLLGGLLPRRRERKPDADFVSDAEPLFPPMPQASGGDLGDERAWPRMDGSLERAAPAWEDEAEAAFEPPPRARPPRSHPPLQVSRDEPGLPFDDLPDAFEAPRPPPIEVHDDRRAVRSAPISRSASFEDRRPIENGHAGAAFDADEDWLEPRADAAAPVPPARAYAPEPAAPRPAPALRRPTRGPASRVPDHAALPELEDPLLPFLDDEIREQEDDSISEPLEARIRRLKEHAPREEEPVLRRRVGPLTAPLEDLGPERADGWADVPAEPVYAPPEPRRQGPPEQYLPPHLRSEPRMSAPPVHPPQPVLSRDDLHRLQAALYELGECRRLLGSAINRD